MGPAQALRQVERPVELNMRSLERPLAAALAIPHLEARPDRLLEQVEPLPGRRRERQPEAPGLVGIVPGADPQHGAAPGQDVERRDHLGEKSGRPVGRGRRHGQQSRTLGVRGDVPERGVRLDVVRERTTHDGVQPHVIGDGDGPETGRFGRLDDVAHDRAEARWTALPARLGNVQAELHRIKAPA